MEVKELTTKDVIMAQLLENTGRALCDSGGAYGRAWERNQGKTWDDFVKDPVTVEAHVYTHAGKSELELMGYIKVAAWMENNLEYSPELQSAFESWVSENDPEGDEYDMTHMEEFAEAVHTGGTREKPRTINTYNEECDLTQTLQFTEFKWTDADDWEDTYVLVQVHGGCDVRGGYTDPKAYKLRCEYIGDWQISGFGCDAQRWDSDGSNCDDHSQPDLKDYPAVEFVYDNRLKEDLEALKQTDKDTEATRALMTAHAETVEREAFEEFCQALTEETFVVFKRKPYFVDDEGDVNEVYADANSLHG